MQTEDQTTVRQHHWRGRLLAGPALALALALVLAGCGGDGDGSSDDASPDSSSEPAASGSPSGDAAPASVRADAAAEWLLGQLEDGVLVGDYGPDYGMTVDAALSLAAFEKYDDEVAEIAETMTKHVASYTTGVDAGAPDDVYAGALAKTAVLAQVAGADPTDFGGVNLIDRLEQRVADQAPVGRLTDEVTGPKGKDYANVIGQAYAVRALATADSQETQAATAYLLDQQCEGGYFRLYFAAPQAAEQGCDAGDAKASPPDVDVTSLGILQLAGQAKDPVVGTALDEATAWLADQEREDGSFGGATSTEAPNANSTGLAGWALGGRGEQGAAALAASWLAGLQVIDQACEVPALVEEAGAVAYDEAALAAAEQAMDTSRTQWRSATIQALPALGWVEGPDASGSPGC